MNSRRLSPTAIIVVVLLVLALFAFSTREAFVQSDEKSKSFNSYGDRFPSAPSRVGNNQIVEHKAFMLSYNNDYEQADWVYYLLTREMVNGNIGRESGFVKDMSVVLGTASTNDYRSSGYDRGHLCPSADVRHDSLAQKETFFMSNISPQTPAFNRGIWKQLEESVRTWVRRTDSLYVVTGPVLNEGLAFIGKSTRVAVPALFYKIVYSPARGGRMIAFLLPNDVITSSISSFIVTVDSIETITGIDFFPGLVDEDSLESHTGRLAEWK